MCVVNHRDSKQERHNYRRHLGSHRFWQQIPYRVREMSQSLVINTFCSFLSWVFMRLYKWGLVTFTWLLRDLLVKQFSLLAFCTVTPKHSIAGKAIIGVDCFHCVLSFVQHKHQVSCSFLTFWCRVSLNERFNFVWLSWPCSSVSSIDLLVMFIGYVLHECFVWGVLFSVECFIESLGSYYFISTIAKKSPGIVLLFVQRNHGEGGMKGESSMETYVLSYVK